MHKKLEIQPDPARTAEGLRDTGYQFNTAVADLIDNSIAANAKQVQVLIKQGLGGQITLVIGDDGEGMDETGLVNAMQYGAKPRPSPASLGKFGLGLKTASTAFCRKLSVISRNRPEAPLIRATWDLDTISTANKWHLVIDDPEDWQKADFDSLIGPKSGTLVVWEKVDRLMGHGAADPAQARRILKRLVESLERHLSMVYQRFLDTADGRATTVSISLGGKKIESWNPFCNGLSQVVAELEPEVELPDGTTSKFRMRAFVLPRKEEFPDDETAKKARLSNQFQGIYIYRENRLIYGPDWLSMFSKEPHYTLLRVEFSFDHKLDEAFRIDIKKSQILLNEALYDCVVDFLNAPRRAAEQAYRQGSRQTAAAASKSAHDISNRNISSKQAQIPQPTISSTDPAKNEAQLVNPLGTVRLKLKITTAAKPLEVHVQPVESIDDGLLWQPCVIDGKFGVQINTGHPYYTKVYLPNLSEGVTVQGMDSLMWGLAVAELNCISEDTKRTFADLRYEVSRNLRKLVEDLPEPRQE
jgi:hypothetical protein